MEGKLTDDSPGNGRAAWEALVNKYNGISNAGRVASYEVLHYSKLQPGLDPDIGLYAMDRTRDRSHEHGEVVTDYHLADRILKVLSDEYVATTARLRAGRRQADTTKHLRRQLGLLLLLRKIGYGPRDCPACER